jgi:hypothetical protein
MRRQSLNIQLFAGHYASQSRARLRFFVFMQLMGFSNFRFDCLRSCTWISDGAFDEGLNPPESAG